MAKLVNAHKASLLLVSLLGSLPPTLHKCGIERCLSHNEKVHPTVVCLLDCKW